MAFWNKKTPTVTLILIGIVDVTSYVAVSDDSRFGYWPPTVLLVTILLTVLNNVRIDRLEARKMSRNKEGDAGAK